MATYMQNLINSKPPGLFILAIEGIDFSGKTTLAHQIQSSLITQSYRVKLLHDPKGSKNAQVIWNTILTLKEQGADAITEFFLFLAARHELISKEVSAGDFDVIIFDRFIFSTIAYQLTHQPDYWSPFLTTHGIFSRLMPDLCIYCDVDFPTFELRSQARNKQDRFDQMSQHRFEAIKAAYEQTLNLNVCPYLRIDEEYNNREMVMKRIVRELAIK